MTKENIVDILAYRDQQSAASTGSSVSDELEKAIQSLIYRLRELGPLPQVG
jgi:hypothetical protein